jgi:hypothetical protein
LSAAAEIAIKQSKKLFPGTIVDVKKWSSLIGRLADKI